MDAGAVFPLVSRPLDVVAVVATVTGRAEAECSDTSFIHSSGLDAVSGLIQVVTALRFVRRQVVPLLGAVQVVVGVALVALDGFG